jgi:hypothetical protein
MNTPRMLVAVDMRFLQLFLAPYWQWRSNDISDQTCVTRSQPLTQKKENVQYGMASISEKNNIGTGKRNAPAVKCILYRPVIINHHSTSGPFYLRACPQSHRFAVGMMRELLERLHYFQQMQRRWQ